MGVVILTFSCIYRLGYVTSDFPVYTVLVMSHQTSLYIPSWLCHIRLPCIYRLGYVTSDFPAYTVLVMSHQTSLYIPSDYVSSDFPVYTVLVMSHQTSLHIPSWLCHIRLPCIYRLGYVTSDFPVYTVLVMSHYTERFWALGIRCCVRTVDSLSEPGFV
jgi:predicted metal-binding transcription factor (methanogenesis marker protein 9)